MRPFHAVSKLISLLLWTAFLIPIQQICLFFFEGNSVYTIPKIYHALICKILGIKIYVAGQASDSSQIFYVGNHLSHFDIFALGSLLKSSFVAKDDIAKWPVAGTLARLQQTAFISRKARDAETARATIFDFMKKGRNIILFPEGTSTRGKEVLPFKSSLFSLPLLCSEQGFGITLQPFTIRLISVDGRSQLNDQTRDLYAWDRDNPISMGRHIWNFAQLKGAVLEIIFHPPVDIRADMDRKQMARDIHQVVAAPLMKPLVETVADV